MSVKNKIINSELVKVQYDPFRDGRFDQIAPTTEAQKEIWTSIKFEEDATLCYNETIELSLNGIINEQILEYAFIEIAKRHESLRCNFSQDGKSILIKNEPGKIFTKKDLSNSFNANQEFEALKNNMQNTALKIEKDNLFSGVLVKFSSNNYKMLILSHHIVCDGWSYAIILNEFSTIYSALVTGESPILNEAVSFALYSKNQLPTDKRHLESMNYWKEQLVGLQKNDAFITDRERTNYRTFNSKRIDHLINSSRVVDFKKLCSKNGVSLYTGLITVFGLLLNKITNNRDQIIGLSSATQPTLENNNLVGHLVNLLPYRFRLISDSSFIELLKNNKAPMLDAFENQFITFGELVSSLKIPRIAGEIPLINIVFNIDQQVEDQGINFINVKSIYKSVPRVYENFEIFINAVSRGNYLELECQYNENLFDPETINNWLMNFEELIELVLFSPELNISNIVLNNLKIPNKKNIQSVVSSSEVINNPSTEILSSIWKRLLINDQIKNNDNFFQLGGHSLLAIEMVNILKDEFSLEIKIKDIFECPTIQELSTRLKTVQVLNPVNYNINSEKIHNYKNNISETKLSNALMQIWYLEELNPKTQMHNLPAAILINEVVDELRFKDAFIKLIERHEAFRTVIKKYKGKITQQVLKFQDIASSFEIQIEKNISKDQIASKLADESNFVFQKDQFPLFKVKLFFTENKQTIMFFMVHHAIWDGWSFDIFFEELNQLYKNPEAELAKIGMTYLEHSDWVNNKLDSGDFKNSSEYWKQKLCPILPVLNIPTDFKRPKELSHIGKSIYFELPNHVISNLKKVAAKSNSSLFNLFLTTFKISLLEFSRENSDEEEIVIGMPIRARTSNDVLNTIGFFVNTLAVRTKIDFNKSFDQNLKIVSNTVIEATEHQLLPFQIVLNEINYDKSNGRNPAFQAFFSYQDVSNRHNEFNDKKYTQVNVDKNSVHTEIDLWIKSSELKTEGAFEFDIQLYESATIEIIKNHFIELLNQLSDSMEISNLNNISIPVSSQNYLIKDFNSTFEKIDERPFFYLIDEQANKNPDKIAIYNKDQSLTYGELKNRSDSLAEFIIQNSKSDEKLIGISLKRNPDMLIAILAILKSNKGYVPLDPNFPKDRIDYMISHSKIETIITEDSLKSKYEMINNIVLLDKYNFNKNNNRTAFDYVQPNQTAYVIYTSGSTGLPKGVEISHLSVSNFLAGMNKFSICSQQDKLLAVTTISFDIAVLEMYLPLINGGTIYLATSSEIIDGQMLKSIIEEENITAMQATPTTWRLLLQSGFKGKSDLTIMCGGESFPIDLAHKLIPIVKKVLNMYGPTETTVWSSVKELNLKDPIISIGRPIANTSFYILNDSLKLVPQGAVGQIFIGGLGLAKGYLNRNDLTSEKFIRNPYRLDELIYATGDLGRINSRGELVCLGRNDGQVKVRGFRIELGEIEALVQKLNGIKECTSIVHDFGNGDKRIVLYYSTLDGTSISEENFKSYLIKFIPGYMIPSFFEKMSDIPKTNNGKIDKKSLPKDRFNKTLDRPVKESISNSKNENTNEDIVDRIWKNILKNEAITDLDNFFDFGGNSLIAVEMMALISDKLDIEIQLSTLLEAKNLKEFKENIYEKNSKHESKNDRSELVPHLEKVFKSLVTIKTQGDLNPIFCFHGVGGNVLNYISLLPALKKQRSLFAFQSIGLDGESEPLLTIDEMALNYYRELKLVKPEGPYILAGGSMGGLIALEVARRLKATGDEIEMLIMFDTFGPNFDLSTYSTQNKKSFLKRLGSAFYRRVKLYYNLSQVYIRRNLGVKIPIKPLLIEIEHKNYQAIWNYHPKKYNGDIILIRSNLEKTGWYSDPDLGWKGIVESRIEKYYIDGKHESFIENPDLLKVLKKILK